MMRYLFLTLLCLAVSLSCGGCQEKSSPEDEGANQSESSPAPETDLSSGEEPEVDTGTIDDRAEQPVQVETLGVAPTFVAVDLDENTIDLAAEAKDADYVLLDFWASWCGPCRGEFPYLRRLQAGYEDKGLRIIGVSLDGDRDDAANAAEQNGLDYPHVFDSGVWENEVAVLYGIRSIPATVLLDSDLNIVAKGLRGAELEAKIEELLGPVEE